MKEMVRYGMVLSLTCALAAASLAGVHALTKSRILAQAQAEEGSALKEVLPNAARFEPVKKGDAVIYYKAYDAEGNFMAVAFKAAQKGYSSVIETMAGMDRDGRLTAIKVISQNETPGLGAAVVEPAFTGQFSGKNIDSLDQVQAITGATISSRAVIEAVKIKARQIKELMANEE